MSPDMWAGIEMGLKGGATTAVSHVSNLVAPAESEALGHRKDQIRSQRREIESGTRSSQPDKQLRFIASNCSRADPRTCPNNICRLHTSANSSRMPQCPNCLKTAAECYQWAHTFCGRRLLPAANQFKLKWLRFIKTTFHGHFWKISKLS